MLKFSKNDPAAAAAVLAVMGYPYFWQRCQKKSNPGVVLLCKTVDQNMEVYGDYTYTCVSRGILVVGSDSSGPRVVTESEFSTAYETLETQAEPLTIAAVEEPLTEGTDVDITGSSALEGTLVTVYLNDVEEEAFVAEEGVNMTANVWTYTIGTLAEHDVVTATHLDPVPGAAVSELSNALTAIGA